MRSARTLATGKASHLLEDAGLLAQALLHDVRDEGLLELHLWVFSKGGCSGRGVQWMGVALCNETVHDIM